MTEEYIPTSKAVLDAKQAEFDAAVQTVNDARAAIKAAKEADDSVALAEAQAAEQLGKEKLQTVGPALDAASRQYQNDILNAEALAEAQARDERQQAAAALGVDPADNGRNLIMLLESYGRTMVLLKGMAGEAWQAENEQDLQLIESLKPILAEMGQ